METWKNVCALSTDRKQLSKTWQNLLFCPSNKMQKPEEVRKTTKTGERLSPTFQHTDVIVLAVIPFQLAAALMTKDVIKPLPLMFCFQTNAFFFFFLNGRISTTENVFHCLGWHGTPAAHVLCGAPIQHKDLTCSHCHKVKHTGRENRIVMMFPKLKSSFLYIV